MALLVMAKAPVPGRVKTRLCPPCSPAQAARIAAAALADTLDAGTAARTAFARTIVLSGRFDPPTGWAVRRQRGDGLAERLANAYADHAANGGAASVLVGMDTPQVDGDDLDAAAAALGTADAAIGPADDGGWWTLALRDPAHGEALRAVPMSTSDTAQRTVAALRARGLSVAFLPTRTDVDTAADARAVAALAPHGRFARAVREILP
jgi:rSAM/selenodomain-associated transferase 1